MTQKHITIVVFCGPSGSGKTELVQRLVEMYPDNLVRWKQATTRAKRGHGDDYVFMTKPMYDVVRSTLTCRTEFNGNHYGTFPEPVNAETAVLTIADAAGLSDLIADVTNHNNHVNNGHSGKLGSHPVKLVTVLMVYDLNDEEIEKRGGTRGGTRGAAFLQAEIDKLNGIDDNITFDHVLDSTGDRWTQPEEFFSGAIWPAICTPLGADTFESLYAQIEHQLIEVGESCRAVRDLDALRGVLATLRGAADYVNEWVNSEPEDGNDVDDIDAVLSGAAAPIVEAAAGTALVDPHGFDEAEQQHPSDYLNDRTPENTPDAVAEEPVPETPLTEEAVVDSVEADPVEVATVEPDPVAEEVPTAALKPYAEIFAESDFTDWMLDNTIGLEAFEDEAKFKLIFSQYVSANGGNPNDIQVGFQATKDGKGGRVVGYTAILPDGARYGVEFNERIKQVVKYGQL